MRSSVAIPTLFSAEAIAVRLEDLAREIVRSVPPDVMVISLLKGSFVFTADLVRAMHRQGMHPQVDFLGLSSYGEGMTSSKKVKITQDLKDDIAGQHVLIVDDILESGHTLNFARNLISSRGAKSIRIAVLLEKPGKRVVSIEPDFTGFSIPDKFVVGYGLDYANRYRELPYIGFIQTN